VLPRDLLLRGFQWQGRRVPLVSAQGIFKPRVLPAIPLTITSSPNGPYEDSFADDHRLMYRYRGTEPGHRDNRERSGCSPAAGKCTMRWCRLD